MTSTAYLSEIFSSFQGEGPYTGEPTTFVRFQGCALSCRWCDTPGALTHKASKWKLENPPRTGKFDIFENTCNIEQLNKALEIYDNSMIALTGGEPLEQAEFISEWLSNSKHNSMILLETAGVFPAKLKKVVEHIDIISMDFKLPSSTGMREYWEQHEEFLRISAESYKGLYIKIVVDCDTTDQDIEKAAQIISKVDPTIPTILQRASATPDFVRIPMQKKLTHQVAIGKKYLSSCSTGRQMHKVWGVL